MPDEERSSIIFKSRDYFCFATYACVGGDRGAGGQKSRKKRIAKISHPTKIMEESIELSKVVYMCVLIEILNLEQKRFLAPLPIVSW